MTSKPSLPTKSMIASLDELSALCEQMVSLSRAGVPLDQGLVQLAKDLPGRLSSQANSVGEQLKSGKSLADVVSDEAGPFPSVYKSVVEAGLRSGQVTVALEGFARLARQLAELRRLVLSALVYPLLLLVLLLAISFLLFRRLGPEMRDALTSLRGSGVEEDWVTTLLEQHAKWSQWFWVLPLLCFALAFFWFFVTQRATSSGPRADWLNWIPGAGRLLRNSRLQAFTEVLALLIRQQVPLETSLRLAGNASGDPGLQADAEQLADQFARGDRQTDNVAAKDRIQPSRGIPPLIRWSLLNSQHSGKLENSLLRASETYQRRTTHSADWLRRTLPTIFSLGLAGIVSLLYAAVVFVPWYAMLHSLSAAMEAI